MSWCKDTQADNTPAQSDQERLQCTSTSIFCSGPCALVADSWRIDCKWLCSLLRARYQLMEGPTRLPGPNASNSALDICEGPAGACCSTLSCNLGCIAYLHCIPACKFSKANLVPSSNDSAAVAARLLNKEVGATAADCLREMVFGSDWSARI